MTGIILKVATLQLKLKKSRSSESLPPENRADIFPKLGDLFIFQLLMFRGKIPRFGFVTEGYLQILEKKTCALTWVNFLPALQWRINWLTVVCPSTAWKWLEKVTPNKYDFQMLKKKWWSESSRPFKTISKSRPQAIKQKVRSHLQQMVSWEFSDILSVCRWQQSPLQKRHSKQKVRSSKRGSGYWQY